MSTNPHRTGKLVGNSAIACLSAVAAHAELKTEKVLWYEAAKVVATTAVETCQGKGFRVSATVVNREGEIVVRLRGDGGSPHTVDNSRRKA